MEIMHFLLIRKAYKLFKQHVQVNSVHKIFTGHCLNTEESAKRDSEALIKCPTK